MVKSQQLLNDYDNTIANNKNLYEIDDGSSGALSGRHSSTHNSKIPVASTDKLFIASNINDYSSSEEDGKNNDNDDNSSDDDEASDDSSSSDDDDDDDDDYSTSSRVSSSDGELSVLLLEQRYNKMQNNGSTTNTMSTKKMKKKHLQNKILRQQQRTKRDTIINLEKELLSISYKETIRLRQWRIIAIIFILLLGSICAALIHILIIRNNQSINKDSPLSKQQEHVSTKRFPQCYGLWPFQVSNNLPDGTIFQPRLEYSYATISIQ
jgi:hypothetical protein